MSFPPKQKLAIVACASFKGTLSSREASTAIAQGLRRAGEHAHVVALADGGEGLVEALVSQQNNARYIEIPARGPLSSLVRVRIGLIGPVEDTTAVLEMAASSGLSLVPLSQRDPKLTTTLGVGDQIRAILDRTDVQVKRILVGIGGSATNDGGAGMAQALGARFLDAAGHELPPGGEALARLSRIDASSLDKRLENVVVTVACDVDNVLCGRDGASFVYGPQKGGSAEDIKLLDDALAHYAAIISRDVEKNVRDIPGAGAAGGLGAGLLAFCNAKLVSGIDLLLDMLDFDELLEHASLVITGEGRLDGQTLRGKAPLGVARRARQKGVPCIAIGGDVEMDVRDELLRHFQATESLAAFAGSTERAQSQAAEMLERLALARAQEWARLHVIAT